MSPEYHKIYNWDIWNASEKPLMVKAPSCFSISICTVCAGRTHDLKSTLLKNITDNKDYPKLEFVILDYNSKDDLYQFMTSEEIRPYLQTGKVKYFRTQLPKYYQTSHSRNIAFKNATGQIVTNVDADNFTGKGFASYLNRLAHTWPRQALYARDKWRIHGRLGMFKDEFERFGGYDEELKGYGWEDYSLMLRVMAAGYTLVTWKDAEIDFSERILTPKSEVAINMEYPDWGETEILNKNITISKIDREELVVNKNIDWGHAEDLERIY